MKLIHVFHSNTESNLVYNAIQYKLDTHRTHDTKYVGKTTHNTHFVLDATGLYYLFYNHTHTDGVRK